ncbi:MAG: hypothetical protein ACO3CS_13270, partial [Alphaproteobacteria bacterium]
SVSGGIAHHREPGLKHSACGLGHHVNNQLPRRMPKSGVDELEVDAVAPHAPRAPDAGRRGALAALALLPLVALAACGRRGRPEPPEGADPAYPRPYPAR